MDTILEHLKIHGEQLDADVAETLGLPLDRVRADMNDLLAQGRVMACYVTRFRKGVKVEGLSCRLAGVIPPAAPGRRAGSPKP